MAYRTESGVEVGDGFTVSRKQYEEGHQNKMPGFETPYDQLADHQDPEDNPADIPASKDVPAGDPSSQEPAVVDPPSGEDTQPGDADLGP